MTTLARTLPTSLVIIAACNAQFKTTGFGAEPAAQPSAAPSAAQERKATAEPQSAGIHPTEPPSAATKEPAGQSAIVWLANAQTLCRNSFNYDPCKAPPPSATEGDSKQCRETCKKEIGAAFARDFGAAVEECLDRYVSGERSANCKKVELPANADPTGTGTGWPAAKQAEAQALCDKQCREGGAQLVLQAKQQKTAEREGHAIVMAYKRCMLSVARTHQALEYRIHDRDLYDDLMQRTHDGCHKKHRCDQLEDPEACYFGND